MRTPFLAAILLLACTATLGAQETATERDAAKDVLRKMAALEQSLDVPGLVAKLTASNAARDQVVARAKELMDKELLALADDLTKHPEIGFQETDAVRKLGAYLTTHGFEVTTGTAGFKTAFVARYKQGAGLPNLGIIVEYDALRGTGRSFHGDQHSTQGPVGIAAAVAMSEYLTKNKLPGTVTVFGTPAEEMMPPPVKTVMHEAKVFDGMDILVRSHSSTSTQRAAAGFGTCCLNINGVRYVFTGVPAHQMMAWEGRNALTAVIHLFNNIDAIRSNLRPETRIQGIIPEGGAAPNVVPDRAVADFYVRYPDVAYLEQVQEMVDNAARGAALATGTQVKIERYGQMRDGIAVASLGEVGFAYLKKYGGTNVMAEPGKPQGYEETGSVSSDIPGNGFSAHTSNSPFHSYGMESDALAEVGHTGFVVDAQAMTAVLFDFATRPEYRAVVKKEFAGLKALYGEYQEALRKAYVVPKAATP
ncbi:MAG: peptidase dimerization domain-containing protein [Gemmatimonadaceae bacterium]|nr:peptidase dimerization domain-containing protein [Gemmatimonadaceae bacterium]